MTKQEAQKLTEKAIIEKTSPKEIYKEIIERITNEAKDGSYHVYICELNKWRLAKLNIDKLETVFKKLREDGFTIITNFNDPVLDLYIKVSWK